jgi:hypothetical protein
MPKLFDYLQEELAERPAVHTSQGEDGGGQQEQGLPVAHRELRRVEL